MKKIERLVVVLLLALFCLLCAAPKARAQTIAVYFFAHNKVWDYQTNSYTGLDGYITITRSSDNTVVAAGWMNEGFTGEYEDGDLDDGQSYTFTIYAGPSYQTYHGVIPTGTPDGSEFDCTMT